MNNINLNHSPQYIVFEIASMDGQKKPGTYLSSVDFKTQQEMMKAKDRIMNYFNKHDIPFEVKLGGDLEELREGDLLAFQQFKNIYMNRDPKKQ